MTNEQLIVLLEGFIVHLGRAIAEAESILLDSVERRAMQKYIGPGLPIPFKCNPDHWETVIPDGAPVIALDPLRDFLERLQYHVTILKGGTCE